MSKLKSEKKDQFIELRAEGLSYADIATKLDVSKQTLCAWGKEFQLEIENCKTIKLDAMFRKYMIAKEKRIEAFGKKLDEVLNELNERDLKDVPTEKLFKIVFELSDRLKAEAEPLRLGEERSAADFDFSHIARWEI